MIIEFVGRFSTRISYSDNTSVELASVIQNADHIVVGNSNLFRDLIHSHGIVNNLLTPFSESSTFQSDDVIGKQISSFYCSASGIVAFDNNEVKNIGIAIENGSIIYVGENCSVDLSKDLLQKWFLNLIKQDSSFDLTFDFRLP